MLQLRRRDYLLDSYTLRKTIAPVQDLSLPINDDGRRHYFDPKDSANLPARLAKQIQMNDIHLVIRFPLDSIDDGSCFHAGISQRCIELDDGNSLVAQPRFQLRQRSDIAGPRPTPPMID